MPRLHTIDLRPISSRDIDNKTFSRLLDDLEADCEMQCLRMPCEDT